MIKIIPSFLSDEECNALVAWEMENHHKFVDANMGGRRKTTRYLQDNINFPPLAIELRNRVKTVLGLEDKVKPPFVHGMVASFAEPGDTCYEHIDPEWHDGHYTLHCNVIIQKPESGGDVVIDGKPYDLAKGDLICFYVSELNHSVTEVIGSTPRLMWIFGFCVDKKTDWYARYAKKKLTCDPYVY
jgi:hypothetical protein